MSFLEIMDIALIVICVVTYGLQVFFKVRGNVLGAVSELIALAEQTGLAGSEKMKQVVKALHEKVPKVLQGILTEDRLRQMAQSIFEWMRKYADTYAEVTAASASEQEREEQMKQEMHDLSVDFVADLASELLTMGLDALKERAAAVGADTDGLKTKNEYAKAILVAALKKNGVTGS